MVASWILMLYSEVRLHQLATSYLADAKTVSTDSCVLRYV
jgi:hypothetical protein